MFSPAHESSREGEGAIGKFDHEVAALLFYNDVDTAERGEVSSQEDVEDVEEDADTFFE
jgi:hypothetical protein